MPSSRSTLKDIIDANLCVGCGLCEGVTGGQTKMVFNDEGFLRPDGVTQNESFAKTIVDACPGHKLHLPSTSVPVDAIWGPLVKCRTGHAAKKSLRFQGSSGGALSAMVASMLESGFADNVIHIAADSDYPIHNKLFVNTQVEDVEAAAGSRYCPSSPLTALPELLRQNERSILVGKPCDIAGARQYIENNPQHRDQVALLVSFMCGGLPSTKGTEEILNKLGVEANEVVSFRYRGDGWPGLVKAETKDGKIATMSYDKSWGEILRNYTQLRCKICPDTVGQFADVVFADAWNIGEDDMPSFDEGKGRSIILTRSILGEKACERAIRSGAIYGEPLEKTMMNKIQPYHVLRKRRVLSRMLALKIMGRKVPSLKNLFSMQAARHIGIWGNIRSFLGTVRRILLKKL